MRKITMLLVLVFMGIQAIYAQRTIKGVVTNEDDGQPISGVTIVVKGMPTKGTITDFDGKYTIEAPAGAVTLIFSFVGMRTKEVVTEKSTEINVAMNAENIALDDVVVTALGISREKKALGYATQEVKGDAISNVKTDNFLNSLSGKVTGIQIKKNTNMGGSTNIVMRGSKSLTGSNQALFVVDGVPIANTNVNADGQNTGGVGYDYGNAASDINSDDIESVNVLKGAAATALYGSRASNGVVMITTKKGSAKTKGIGITVNSGITVGSVDKSTFPKYQSKYGAGYGPYYDSADGFFLLADINGDGKDDLVTPVTEDASFGAPFDPTLMVYQWNSLDPELPNYKKATPWVAAANGPITFFEKPMTYTNSLSIENSFDKGSYRLSYNNYKQSGLLPNSELKKNTFGVNGVWKVNDRLTATVSSNFSRQKAFGRNSTGYNDNIMSSMRQWMEVNVDYKELKDAFDLTGRNVTWNPAFTSVTDLAPIYWDNPYWTRYKNYQTDERNRYIGNLSLEYKITDWVSVMGRAAFDTYDQLIEERRALGSVPATFGIDRTDMEAGYLRRNITFGEYNYDLMANFKKDITESLNFTGLVGLNIRRTNNSNIMASTSGSLVSPEIYSLQNSSGPLPFPVENEQKIGVNGIYASASFGFKSMLFLDATIRQDHSSTLPKENSTYIYPSIASSFVFSNLIKNNWLSLGKVRLSYAQVGSSAPFDQLKDIYLVITPFNTPLYQVPATKKNPVLKPEKTSSIEGGLEMSFFSNRLGIDIAAYKTNSTDQILPLSLTQTTGYSFKYINAGEIENKGIELALTGSPIVTNDFKWDIKINWSKNKNQVVDLIEGVDNLQLGSFQGGVTVNARKGEPYGVLLGTDYTYTADGQKILSASTGKPIKTTTTNNVIGNVTPDWNGVISNTISYKNFSFSFLIDMQKGGDLFSLDMYYGLSSGLYEETAGNNDLGNPIRSPIVYNNPAAATTALKIASGYAPTSGGYLIEGANVSSTGAITPNVTRVNTTTYAGLGYGAEPNKAFIYDAGYVKLREVVLAYNLPAASLKNFFIKGISISAVASNLWIISKHLPYADPEAGLSSGNVQGYSIGPLPTTRDFGFNVKLNF